MKRIQSLLLLILIVPFFLVPSGCNSGEAKQKAKKLKKPPLVEVRKAKQEPISDILELTGEIVATNIVTIRATMEGPIGFCPWREGDRVERAGQKLIVIDRPLYREEVKAAKAALLVATKKLADLKAGPRPEEIAQARETVKKLEEATAFAKTDLDRVLDLVKKGAVPGEMADKAKVIYARYLADLASAKEHLSMLEKGPTKTQIEVQESLVKEAKAKLSLAKARLDECTIRAPFAGIITRVYVRPGDLAVLKAPLLEMLDPSSLVVRFGIPEKYAFLVHKGTRLEVRLDAYPGKKKLHGVVTRVYPQLEKVSRTRTVEGKIAEHIDLAPGMFARVTVELKRVNNAVVVPDSAVLTRPDGSKIAFVVKNGKAELRKITTGIERGKKVQIISGIRAGEAVVVAGNERLKNGSHVRIMAKPQTKGSN